MRSDIDKCALLTRQQAADVLGVKVNTLAVWATTGRYRLPYVRVGRSARYSMADLLAFIDARRVCSTGEAAELQG